jgi:N-acetylneuraminate synthase
MREGEHKMNYKVRIGDQSVGEAEPCYIVAEIGINHNGDMEIAKKLISAALASGCNAIKFQKRTVGAVYTPEELSKPRQSPFGETNGDLKYGLEFGYEQYKEIDEYCQLHNLTWYASCWDEESVDFIEQFSPVCYKIPSPLLTNDNLLRYHRQYGRPIILSTGMSTLEQIDHAVNVLGTDDLVLLHCTSTYPSKLDELNLTAIQTLRERYNVPIGYSGHEVGLATTIAAFALGACMIERHISLDRALWGSDQAASVEPQGFFRIVRDIRSLETSMGDGVKKVYESEIPIMKKLRKKLPDLAHTV